MSYADVVGRSARRVVAVQALLTVAVAGAFFAWGNANQAMAAGFGGVVTIGITVWLAWRARVADSLAAIYSASLARYVMAMAALAVGFAVFRFPALPLLCGFAVTQFGFLALLRQSRRAGE